jgi:hypothetical protein
MQRFGYTLGVSLGLLCIGAWITPCWAQSSQMSMTHVEPMVFKLHMDPSQMSTLVSIMHSKMDHCFLEDLDPGDDASLVMICGVPEGVTSFGDGAPPSP